jgi:hypothetical protein
MTKDRMALIEAIQKGATDPVGAAAARETGTFAAKFTPDLPPVSPPCGARP